MPLPLAVLRPLGLRKMDGKRADGMGSGVGACALKFRRSCASLTEYLQLFCLAGTAVSVVSLTRKGMLVAYRGLSLIKT